MTVQRKIKYEKCVVCHCETKVLVDTPVDFRKNFIRGVGELCDKCFSEIYLKTEPIKNKSHNGL